MVPQAVPEQPAPATAQVTALFVLPDTEALNVCCPPTVTWAEVGDTFTDTEAAGVKVTLADADFVESALEVAVTMAEVAEGRADGAV
jgi:hypothetical protein